MSHSGADRTRDSIPFPKSLRRAVNHGAHDPSRAIIGAAFGEFFQAIIGSARGSRGKIPSLFSPGTFTC
jgi:hypothetical protein